MKAMANHRTYSEDLPGHRQRSPNSAALTVSFADRRARQDGDRDSNVRRDPLACAQISLFFSRKQGDFQEKQGGD
jgi:hypothetical protein